MSQNPSAMRVLVVVFLAFACLSGTADTAPNEATPPPVADRLAEDPVDGLIRAELAELNPHLLASQVERIRAAVRGSSARHGLDPLLVMSIMKVESTGRPEARSPLGALGLMQVMTYMIGPMDLAGNPSTIEANIEAGCVILAGNIRRLGEDDGISTYFWGSRIRGTAYLDKVRAAQDSLGRDVRS